MLLVYLYVPGPLAHGRLDPNRHPARAVWMPATGCGLELGPAPDPRRTPPDIDNPAGAHPTTTSRNPFLTKDFFEPKKHASRNMGEIDSIRVLSA
jgi:hypothetical protein